MRELLLKIMAVLTKVGTLHKQLPSVLVDPCLYYCCTAHQALAALRSLHTEGCVRIVRSIFVHSELDTTGPRKMCPGIIDVSLSQGLICTQNYTIGTSELESCP